MARKLPGLQRNFGAETIFAIVYGEVSSSLYFALGVVSLWALGLTPLVLLGAGLLFGLAAAAYQEGVRAVDQPGGSAAVARHAFGDLAGFVVGWAVVLDFGVVIALSLLFVPHYALAMVGDPGALTHPADELIAVGLAVAIAGGRLIRRPGLYRASIVVAGVDIGVQLLLAVLGLAVAFHPHELTRTLDFGAVPSWNALAFSIPLAMIAFTGLEIVALVMREVKKPADTFARGMVSAVLATIVLYAVIATVALTALPVTRHPDAPSGYASDVSERYLSAPLAGVARAVGDSVTSGFGGVLRAVVAASAVLILMFSAITAFSGAARVLRGLGDTSCLPGPLATTNRRFATSPYLNGIVVVSVAGLYGAASLFDREVTGLASIYSFGLMLAFMAVFLAVIKLRVVEPSRPRPVMMRGNMRFGRSLIPLPAVAGFLLSWLVWLLALGTHRAGRGRAAPLAARRRDRLPDRAPARRDADPRAQLGRGARAAALRRGAVRHDHRPVQAGGPDRGRDARHGVEARPGRGRQGDRAEGDRGAARRVARLLDAGGGQGVARAARALRVVRRGLRRSRSSAACCARGRSRAPSRTRRARPTPA